LGRGTAPRECANTLATPTHDNDESSYGHVADSIQLAIVQLPPPGPHHPPTQIATFAFDTTQELLWTGNEYVSTLASSSLWVSQANNKRRDELPPSMALASSVIPRIADMQLVKAPSSSSSSPRRASSPFRSKAHISPYVVG
jgi:hypothetical protein